MSFQIFLKRLFTRLTKQRDFHVNVLANSFFVYKKLNQIKMYVSENDRICLSLIAGMISKCISAVFFPRRSDKNYLGVHYRKAKVFMKKLLYKNSTSFHYL